MNRGVVKVLGQWLHSQEDHSRIQASFGMFVLNFPDARSFFPGLAERGGPQIPINLVAASK